MKLLIDMNLSLRWLETLTDAGFQAVHWPAVGKAGAPRCQHRTASGERCRLRVVDPRSGLCFRHSAKQSELLPAADLRTLLAGEVTQFECAYDVNKFLSNLLLLLSENRVAPRRAAVMAYTWNLLLRTLVFRERELEQSDDNPVRLDIDFGDLPRPNRQQTAAIPVESSHSS